MIWIATRDGVLNARELRLVAVFCARQNQHLLTDERSLNAIDVAERYANGIASDDELLTANAAANAAARAAANAARAAAARAATDATYAACAAARAAANAAADAAANAAANATRDSQAQYIRQNTKPNF